MEMTLRWYGSKFDTVTLKQIRQIPGVKGIITTLYDTEPGEVWSRERIRAMKEEVAAAGLHIAGIESVNIHDAIKTGAPEREKYIANYIETLENLGREDIHLICYNFMPVFDWTRTELARMREDGSTVLAYTQEAVDALKPENMFESIAGDMNGSIMPGWEPERMEKVKKLFEMYKDVDDDKLFENLKYFLEKIMPVCDKYNINMAIHPDDPAWSVFGLPRIIINKENIHRMMKMVDNPHNGVTFCSGSYGTNLDNDLPDMIRSLKGRIHFAHVRNLKFITPTNFEEAAHLSSDGNFDMHAIMRALYDIGFDGPIRPDHGRMIWDEVAMPGYGLYDRALGACYLQGLWEAIEKETIAKGNNKMKWNHAGITDKAQWEEKGYRLPSYDRETVAKATKENPVWIHFGAGNIFRAFPANVVQNLLNAGALDRGLIVAEGFDYEIIEKMYRPHDNYSLLVTLKADGKVEKTVIGSIMESCILDSENEKEFARLKEIFKKDSLQMASFTITEKGYSLVDGKGELLPSVEADFTDGAGKSSSYIGKVASLLYVRFKAGQKTIAMVSMDNCSHNGERLYEAVNAFAVKWAENGLVEKEFVAYIQDKNKVSFPWSVIDKITPRPDASVEAILKEDGVDGVEPVITAKNTYAAPFVNAEECEYLVIEDAFPNGRPPLEQGGIIFTDKETVDKVEKMKVCTCLNPLHTALAVFGCLLGYKKIADEMQDKELRKMVENMGYIEGLPVVVNPGVLDPKEFMDTVLNVRIPNPFMPDTPQRIATDTSQKLAIRLGETIKAYAVSPDLKVTDLKMIPLVFAGWLRYLMAVDDEGNSFSLSSDPLLDTVCPYVADFRLGKTCDAEEKLAPLLKDKTIWGVDLYEVKLAQKVLDYFAELTAGVGAVRKTLKKYV